MPSKHIRARDYLLAGLAACGIVGPLEYIGIWIVAGLLYPGYNQLTQATSELTSRTAPPAAAALANGAGIALGLLMIAFAFGLHRGVQRNRWQLTGTILIALFGLVCVIQPFFPLDPAGSSLSWQNVMHSVVYVVSGVALIPGQLVLAMAFARDPNFRAYRCYTLITPFAMILAGQINVVSIFPAGVPERLSTLVIFAWIELVAFRLLCLVWRCGVALDLATSRTNGQVKV